MKTGPDQSDDQHDLLVRRVRKLLDKAAATSNEHEADAFARKAAELIAEHRIDPVRLAGADDELDVVEIDLGRGAYVRARLALLMAVAHVNDVEVVFTTRPTGTVALAAGFRSDLSVVTSLYTILHSQAAAGAALRRSGTAAATQRDRRSFLFGFADRTRAMLEEASAEQDRSADSGRRPTSVGAARTVTPAATAGTGLALAARRERVAEFASSKFGPVRTARRPAAATERGFRAGEQAATTADIGRTRLAGRKRLGRGAS